MTFAYIFYILIKWNRTERLNEKKPLHSFIMITIIFVFSLAEFFFFCSHSVSVFSPLSKYVYVQCALCNIQMNLLATMITDAWLLHNLQTTSNVLIHWILRNAISFLCIFSKISFGSLFASPLWKNCLPFAV